MLIFEDASSKIDNDKDCVDLIKMLKENMNYGRLGSIGPDLPYFNGVLKTAASFLLSRYYKPEPIEKWGDLLHSKAPHLFPLTMIEIAWRETDPDDEEWDAIAKKQWAFIIGYLTHMAADQMIHPYVNKISGNYYRDKEKRGKHLECEVYQDVVLFNNRYKKSILDENLDTWVNIGAKSGKTEPYFRVFLQKRTDGLEKSSALIEDFLKRDLTSYERSLSHYYFANALDNKNNLRQKRGEILSKWDNCEIEGEILNLRLSLIHLQFAKDNEFTKNKKTKIEISSCKNRNCQIYTNLGNLMDNIGRFIEGIEYRDEALNINPKFGMAIGNKGLSYIWYAPFLPDKNHQAIFYHEAYRLLKTALQCQLEPGAPEGFQKAMLPIESMLKMEYLNKKLNLNPTYRGSNDEIKYKTWCVQNLLYLNPLNDLGDYSIAAKDDLIIPTGDMRVDYGINCHTFFNHLKQEFVAARYLYYNGITENRIHFSDRDIVFGETYDRPLFSLASEKIKISFRLSYSIFDKIAFFLNYYFNLNLKERDIYFRSIWYENRKKNHEEKQILSVFLDKNKNLPLIGLFWLST